MKKIVTLLGIFIFVTLNSGFSQFWVQKGSTIPGDGYRFGYKIKLSGDGSTVVVGSYQKPNGDSTNAGSVKVYTWDNTTQDWVQKGNEIQGTNQNELLGMDVDIDETGSRIFVGSPGYDNNKGKATIYGYDASSGTWYEITHFQGSNPDDRLGYSVSLNNGLYAVGSPTSDAGHVMVFTYISSIHSWMNIGQVLAGENSGDYFGYRVVVSDTMLAVSAPYHDGNKGKVYIYAYQEDNAEWIELGTHSGNTLEAKFGSELDFAKLSGNFNNGFHYQIAVSEPYYDSNRGRIFYCPNKSTNGGLSFWGVYNGMANSDEQFGRSLAYKADVIAIGAPYNDSLFYEGGRVEIRYDYLFVDSSLTFLGEFTGNNSYSYFGRSVSLSNDAKVLAISSLGETTSGYIKIYEQCITDTVIEATLCENDYYVLPSGDTVFSSGYYTDTLTSSEGCDSIVHVHLTTPVFDTTVTVIDSLLIANDTNATYQWVDCNNGYAPVSGATSRIFLPSETGDYAVVLTIDGCSDTSACYHVNITTTALNEPNLNTIVAYPNPTTGILHIALGEQLPVAIQITDITGKVIYKQPACAESQFSYDFGTRKGIYFVKISTATQQKRLKVIVQ